MGPIHSRYIPGRGDKWESCLHNLYKIKNKEFEKLLMKYPKLSEDAKEELEDVLKE